MLVLLEFFFSFSFHIFLLIFLGGVEGGNFFPIRCVSFFFFLLLFYFLYVFGGGYFSFSLTFSFLFFQLLTYLSIYF